MNRLDKTSSVPKTLTFWIDQCYSEYAPAFVLQGPKLLEKDHLAFRMIWDLPFLYELVVRCSLKSAVPWMFVDGLDSWPLVVKFNSRWATLSLPPSILRKKHSSYENKNLTWEIIQLYNYSEMSSVDLPYELWYEFNSISPQGGPKSRISLFQEADISRRLCYKKSDIGPSVRFHLLQTT